MKFEEKLKKRLIKQLDKDVPNPYAKKRFSLWPLWAKIALPVGSLVLTGSIVAAIVVPNINKNNLNTTVLQNPIEDPKDKSTEDNEKNVPENGGDTDKGKSKSDEEGKTPIEEDSRYVAVFDALTVGAPKATNTLPTLDNSFVNRTAMKTIQNLENYFAIENNKNCVLSPSCYLLTASALAAVSDNFDLEAFGLDDAGEDTKSFLEALNCSMQNDGLISSKYDAGILHQQVGSTFAFDDEKRAQVSDYYIGTTICDLDNYNEQAKQYFEKKVNLSIPIPDPHMNYDGIITYGAIKMEDHCSKFESIDEVFYPDKDHRRWCYAAKLEQKDYDIYTNDKFLAFKLDINSSSMVIVLPNEGVALESISLSEAYETIINETFTPTNAKGFLPYFHLRSESVDLTRNFRSRLTGNELLYSKLVQDDVNTSGLELTCLQSSDFEFNDEGIAAESITLESSVGAAPSDPTMTLCVNRPFYAFNLRDNFPLFVCKVNNPIETLY